jgi:phosphoglycerol transferase MdoB-like AlkP superfamily enzyme
LGECLKILLVLLPVATALLGVALLLARKLRLPAWIARALDLLPVAWFFGFTLLAQYAVRWLIPVKEHKAFPANALAAAGCVALLSALLPRRLRLLGTGSLALGLALLAFADIIYDRYFGNVVPLVAAQSARHLWDVRDSILAIVEPRDAWVLAFLLAGALVLGLWRALPVTALPRPAEAALWLVPVVVIAAASVPPVHRDVSGWLDSKYAREVLNRHDSVEAGGIVVAHIREAALAIKQWRQRRELTPEERAQTVAWYRERAVASADESSSELFGAYAGKNVIVLQVEALEEWILDAKVRGQEVTPFLNRLKAESLYYPLIFDQTGSSSTSDCEYLVLNSQHPLDNGSVAFRRESNQFTTLATVLLQQGYSTVSMHAYHRGMWNRAYVHPRYGFERSLFRRELGDEPRIGWGLDDVVFFDRATPQLQAEKAPFLAFMITLSSHHPYSYIPRKKRRLKLGELEGSMVGNYLHSVRYADEALEGFFKKLEEIGLLEESVIVIYGDHDGHLKRGGRDPAAMEKELEVPEEKRRHIAKGTWVLDRVPLLIRTPKGAARGVVEAIGGQADVAPTVLHLLGVPRPGGFLGRALLPGMSGGQVTRWDGATVGDGKIFEPKKEACLTFPELGRLTLAACQELGERAALELEMSWRATNHDLSRALTDEMASQARQSK